MVYGVAAGAIRVLKHLAFRVLKNKTKICLGPFDDRRPKGFRRSRKATPRRNPFTTYANVSSIVNMRPSRDLSGPFPGP